MAKVGCPPPTKYIMSSPIFWSSLKQLADPTFNNIYPVSHKLQKQRQTWAYLFFRLMTWRHRTCPWYHRKVWWDREGILWRPSEVSVPMTSRSRGGGLLILSCLCSHLHEGYNNVVTVSIEYFKATGGLWGLKIMLSVSERFHWAVKTVEDRVKRYCSKPELWFF